jgi:WD40 repeat protein
LQNREKEDIIDFNKEYDQNLIKISSDINKINNKELAVGINKDVLLYDINSKERINTIKNVCESQILSCKFNHQISYLLTTSGTDPYIKTWDIRQTKFPINIFNNNQHWVWDIKYNNTYSKLLLASNSNSTVRVLSYSFNDYSFLYENNKENNYPITIPTVNKTYDYIAFDDSVYCSDWFINDPWLFASISGNGYFYVNQIPSEMKYKIMLDT